jgi:hypothetical protein
LVTLQSSGNFFGGILLAIPGRLFSLGIFISVLAADVLDLIGVRVSISSKSRFSWCVALLVEVVSVVVFGRGNPTIDFVVVVMVDTMIGEGFGGGWT